MNTNYIFYLFATFFFLKFPYSDFHKAITCIDKCTYGI